MTKLETFSRSIKGLALSGVITAALYPHAHSMMMEHAEASFRADIAALAPVEVPGGELAFANPFIGELARLEQRMEILDAAQEGLASRYVQMSWVMESFDQLREELGSLVVDESKIDPRRQVEILSEVMVEWLEGMKAQVGTLGNPQADMPSVMVSAPWSSSDIQEKIADLDHRVRATADAIKEFSVENARLEALLSEMTRQLDIVVRVAANGSSDLEEAYAAFEKYGELIASYNGSENAEGAAYDAADGTPTQSGGISR